jgi:glycosyltransferase involved in cell wall biosynthesis
LGVLIKNKKILIVTECFYPEEFKVNDVALSWKDKGYDVDVLTMVPTYPESHIFDGYKNKFYQKEDWRGINIYRVLSTTGYKESLFKKLLKYFVFMVNGSVVALFIGKKYDFIFGFNVGPLTAMLPAILIRKLYKKPLTLWVQDIWPDSVYAYGFKKTKVLSFVLDKFVKFIYYNIDNIAISGRGFKSILQSYTKDSLTFNYLPNWADNLDMSLDSANFGDDKVQFTFAGNVGTVQNLENIIKAFNSLSDEYAKRAQFNIIGTGSALEGLKSLNIQSNVVFHGRKPRNKMSKYYKASDFLIVSLVDEPIFSVTVPAKMQTYIYAKRPILAIIKGDTASIVRDNNLGYTADPNDIDNIKNIFVQAIDTDGNKIEEFTKNCNKLNKDVFNRDSIINHLLRLTTTGKES